MIRAVRSLSLKRMSASSVSAGSLYRLTSSLPMETSTGIIDNNLKHLFDKGPWDVYLQDIINLAVGAPGPDFLKECVHIFKLATEHRMKLEEENAYLFQYGIPCGLWEFRQELAGFLSRHYGDKVNREQLVLTCGASHGLHLLMTTLLCPKSIIFVEEVTYMIAITAFKQYPEMKIVPVPINSDGIDSEKFREIAHQHKRKGCLCSNKKKPYCMMLYTIPVFHNPTGFTASKECCESIVKISEEMDILVVSEDVYNLLYYGDNAHSPKRLIAYERDLNNGISKNVISNGTFSKIMAPGVRVGWLECPPAHIPLFQNSGILLSGGGTNQYMSGIMTSIMQLQLADKHLQKIRAVYTERVKAFCDTLEKNLPANCEFKRPEGGYFLWLKLPENVDAENLIEWCSSAYKVSALSGNKFSPEGKYGNYVRFGFAFHNKEKLEEGALKFCAALKEYISR